MSEEKELKLIKERQHPVFSLKFYKKCPFCNTDLEYRDRGGPFRIICHGCSKFKDFEWLIFNFLWNNSVLFCRSSFEENEYGEWHFCQ